MKNRLLTALVGLTIAVGWLFTMYTPFFAIIMALVAGIAAYEMMKVFGIKNKLFFILGEAIAVGTVLFADYSETLRLPVYSIVTAAVILGLILMVTDYEHLKFEQVACSLVSVFLIPSALATVVHFRDVYITFPSLFTKNDGIFFILFAFFCSWITDACALFTGMAIGKHKLAPVISPKKTVEGAVGGVIGNMLLSVLLWYIFKTKFNLSSYINIVWVIVSALILSVISIFGDLAASTIKRHSGIKDFGNLLPGHGGIMDRFDSSIFVFAGLWAEILMLGRIVTGG